MIGIEYISEDLSKHPQCIHGPTLLFSRCVNEKGQRRKFFACSACRDRKLCSFFLWEDEHQKEKKPTKSNIKPIKINHIAKYKKLNEILQINEKLRLYCLTCNEWVEKNHENHEIKNGVSDENINFPSTFLSPLSNNRKEAQYLFSENSVAIIINILQSIKVRNVLCIGAPRIHEQILNNYPEMSSLLLDLDQRYHNFYGPLQFCWYNLFNHHFFLPNSERVFKDFVQNSENKLVILMDPPFGGRTEPIAQTLKTIERLHKKNLPVFLFFPYFMEPQIKNSLNYEMVDYKVDYDNHALFKDGEKGRKFGSPVRMFTNLPLSQIKLPEDEGYRFCSKCNRWVYKENKHCKKCDACTSKDGRTYVHCKKCSRCVKPTWQHCEVCNRCAQVDHKCGNISFDQRCFHCKGQGHKKIDCPEVDHESLKRKRQTKKKIKKKSKSKQ